MPAVGAADVSVHLSRAGCGLSQLELSSGRTTGSWKAQRHSSPDAKYGKKIALFSSSLMMSFS